MEPILADIYECGEISSRTPGDSERGLVWQYGRHARVLSIGFSGGYPGARLESATTRFREGLAWGAYCIPVGGEGLAIDLGLANFPARISFRPFDGPRPATSLDVKTGDT